MKPDWLKVPLASGQEYLDVLKLIKDNNIHTICQEAKCPNQAECFSKKTATFLILGNICTRNCMYCNVKHGEPGKVNPKEAEQVAKAVKTLGLEYVVITSPSRDDLKDGGALTFIRTIKEIRKLSPYIKIEILTPDFRDQIKKILNIKPDVFGHNIETVKRLFNKVRFKSDYIKSLIFLKQIKEYNPSQLTKSGFMIGLGETKDEILQTIRELKMAKVDIITIGQYLQPRDDLAEVDKYYKPEEFEEFKKYAEELGFKHVESGPLVRSSYHAKDAL
jgi:lipoyl synthase